MLHGFVTWLRGVPGTEPAVVFCATLAPYRMILTAPQQKSHGRLCLSRLRFFDAGMTDSCDADVARGGEGTNLQRVGSLSLGSWARICAAAVCLLLPGSAMPGTKAHATSTIQDRKLPMNFTWHAPSAGACREDCRGWIAAVGVITAETPAKFEDFASGRDLKGATVVLDSGGGSVLDAIALGRRWRDLKLRTTVGTVIERAAADGIARNIAPGAYCESMCVFLLLSGEQRHVPDGARVRVHQIWMGDRADDAKGASYSAQDLMIVERDIGRLAKYTFDMGGSGELLSLALSVPPWEPLHELSAAELRATNLVTMDAVADAAAGAATASVKPIQDRFTSEAVNPVAESRKGPRLTLPTKTAEAGAPTGGAAGPERK